MGSALIFATLCFILYKATDTASPEHISMALTNLAAVGGIASGLSFASLSIFTLNGTYQKKVLNTIGNTVRGTLFYLLFVVMLVSILSGIFVIWSESQWIKYVLPVFVFLIVESFYLTFRIVFTAYEWEAEPTKESPALDEFTK